MLTLMLTLMLTPMVLVPSFELPAPATRIVGPPVVPLRTEPLGPRRVRSRAVYALNLSLVITVLGVVLLCTPPARNLRAARVLFMSLLITSIATVDLKALIVQLYLI
jgi:hypothetical protein